MSIRDIVVAKIALAADKTRSLFDSFTLYQWTGQNGFGEDTFSGPITVSAAIGLDRKRKLNSAGQLIMTLAELTVIELPAPNGSTAEPRRTEPIDPRDRIVLPDGQSQPIQIINSFKDAGGGIYGQFYLQITLGEVIGSGG